MRQTRFYGFEDRDGGIGYFEIHVFNSQDELDEWVYEAVEQGITQGMFGYRKQFFSVYEHGE